MTLTASAMRHAFCLTVSAALLLLFCIPLAFAQADAPQYKTQSVSAFGGFLYDHQDFTSGYNKGFMFGMDFTRHIHFPVQPSLEARVNLAPGSDVTEHSYVFGPVLNAQIGRFRPYGDFELGFGNIHFNRTTDSTYTRDASAVYSGGGGLEIGLDHHLRLKLDMQYQHWNLGHTAATVFTPIAASAGISYTIPFRSFRKQSDPSYR